MLPEGELAHGTCIALGECGAILTGPPGSGKSDLALRFIFGTPPELEPSLVADDQVVLRVRDGRLYGSPPGAIAGLIEVRGVGIVKTPYREEARIGLIAGMADPCDIPRLPPSPPRTATVGGVALPYIAIAPFEVSAHVKLRIAIQNHVQ